MFLHLKEKCDKWLKIEYLKKIKFIWYWYYNFSNEFKFKFSVKVEIFKKSTNKYICLGILINKFVQRENDELWVSKCLANNYTAKINNRLPISFGKIYITIVISSSFWIQLQCGNVCHRFIFVNNISFSYRALIIIQFIFSSYMFYTYFTSLTCVLLFKPAIKYW